MSDNSTSNAQTDICHMKEDDEISLLDLLQVIVDNLRLLVLGPLVFGLAALGISFAIKPTYTAKTQFLTPQQQQSYAASVLASLGGLTGASTNFKSPSDQYIAFMKSVSIQDALIERFKLMEKYDAKHKMDARLELSSNVRIGSGKDGLISIEVDDKDAKLAADLANAHVEELQTLTSRLAITEAQQRRMFFEKQLIQTKKDFLKADLALKSSGINSTLIKSSPSSALEVVARLKAGISVQEVKLGAMRNYLTENSPEFKQALSELASLKSQLTKAEDDEPTVMGASNYVERYREFKYQETMFEMLAKQFELAKIDESREGALIQVLDIAETPERKSKPNKLLISTISTISSGFILLIFIIIRSAMKKLPQTNEEKQRLISIKASWKKAFGR